MNQTIGLLVDAYRELNAKKLFWITLILTGVVVVALALIGITDKGLSIAGAVIPMSSPDFAYKWLFSYIFVGIYAKIVALALALISTASIFPDLIAGGSIDLYLSKPISRLRLFLTKYATGLLFTLVQISLFTIGSYVVFGLRAHDWKSSLFLTIPLILLLYSYVFCFCVLVGILTRSTIAAILLTVLFWAICVGLNFAERTLYTTSAAAAAVARADEKQVRNADAELRDIKNDHSVLNMFGFRESRIRERRDRAQSEADDAKRLADKISLFHRIAYLIATVIPKTGETVDLLDRKLFDESDVASSRETASRMNFGPPDAGFAPQRPATNPAEELAQTQEDQRDREERQQIGQDAREEVVRAERSRSIPWILGTSLAFEAVLVTWGAWIFCRRDY